MTRSPPAPHSRCSDRSQTGHRPTDGNGDTAPTPRVLGPQPEPDLIDIQVLLEVIDGAVRGIFSVALTLSAARNLTKGPATTRLDRGLDEIDDLVRGLRHTALDARLPTRTRAPAGIKPPPRITRATRASDLVDQAAGALTDVDAVLIELWNDAVAATPGPVRGCFRLRRRQRSFDHSAASTGSRAWTGMWV